MKASGLRMKIFMGFSHCVCNDDDILWEQLDKAMNESIAKAPNTIQEAIKRWEEGSDGCIG